MRILWGCLAVFVIAPLVGLFCLIMIPIWRDNARLDDFHERVLAYPLPSETRSKSDSEATFDKVFGGSGDYCEYRVRLSLQTSLSQKEIWAHYGKATIAGADDSEKADIRIRFGEETGDGRAVIVEFGDISPSDWDWRCT
ncbi:hypothetical protein AB0J35_48865 [Nonomuraea angiospora]|uniref:hypothetical protein n=1 Tax=Nonomuraea angiospora TaxID=46172 RepID=UPI00344327D6